MSQDKTLIAPGAPLLDGPDLIQIERPGEPAGPLEPEAEGHPATWTGRHLVNVRLTIPLLFGRFYLTLVFGKERRSDERLKTERHRHPLITVGNLAFFFAMGSTVGLAILALLNLLAATLYATV